MEQTDKDPSEMTLEEQVAFLKAQPDGGQTDNSPDENVPQPPQDPSWDPNSDPDFDTIDPEELI